VPSPSAAATQDGGDTTTTIWDDVVPLLSFSAQTLCIAVTNPLLSLVDTSVVGLTSETQLAAMAPATILSDGVGYACTFIPIAVTNLVALHMSRSQPRAAGTRSRYVIRM
jgi:Na+-driven multidrug efflux pump